MVMALYRTPLTCVRTCFGTTEAFEVNVGLHQGSALSPLIFIIILNYINKKCPMERGQKLMYADDIAIGMDTAEDLQEAMTMWHDNLAAHGMRMSKAKTEVLVVSRKQPVPRIQILTEGQQQKQTSAFKYLGSWLQESGDLDREVQARLQGIGNACRGVSGVIHDKKMPSRLKAQVYKTMVRPVAVYGGETWAVKEEHMKKLEVAEMRCLRAVRGVTRRDRRRNDEVRNEVGVTEIREKIRESRLRWYGHVKRREEKMGCRAKGKSKEKERPTEEEMDGLHQ